MQKTRIRLGIDLDGVMYDFVGSLRQFIHQTTDKPLSEMPDPVVWDFFKTQWGFHFGEYADYVAEGVRSMDIFWEGEPTEGSLEVLDELNRHYDIIIVTARDFRGIEDLCVAATKYWLNKWAVPHKELIVTSNKIGLNLGLLLDDSPHNIENALLHGEHATVYDQAWNRDLPDSIDRVYNWKDFANYVKEKYGSNT